MHSFLIQSKTQKTLFISLVKISVVSEKFKLQ